MELLHMNKAQACCFGSEFNLHAAFSFYYVMFIVPSFHLHVGFLDDENMLFP